MQIGDRLDTYEILELIGKGGMGEVYRARDSELGRDVAIKVLPAELADDEDRLSRLRREARSLASLNHQGIATVHGFHEHAGTRFIVMEMVEGETLAEKLQGGRLPVEMALRIALQIAKALEAAHASGIVHRDLKPANIKVTDRGSVKVLDFGLAMTLAAVAAPDRADSPTLSMAATRAGVILGTAGYMSPEQARGLEVDRRTDVWALGVVLLEMLTGQRTFQGNLVTDTLAAVIKDDPGLERLPAGTPATVRRLLDRCLRKDPDERFHDVADVALLLQDAMEQEPEERQASAPPRSSLAAGTAVAVAAAGLIVGAGAVYLTGSGASSSPPSLPSRSFVLTYGDVSASRPALAPDNQRLAYVQDDRIWIRDLRGLEALAVPGTEGGTVPFWSPDGAWLGFSADRAIWKIRPDGSGRARITTAAVAPGTTAGAAVWLPDDRVVFDTGTSELLVAPARGGEATTYAPLQEGEADFHFLTGLPDGQGLLTVVHRGLEFKEIVLFTPDGQRREVLTLSGAENLGNLAYAASGHILFERQGSGQAGIWAVPFSAASFEVTGEPFPVVLGASHLAVGSDGTLVYGLTLPPVESEIALVDRTGSIVDRIGAPMRGIYPSPAVSPDEQTVVVPVAGSQGMDLWAFDRGAAAPRRLTFEESAALGGPSWSPDGTQVYFLRFEAGSGNGIFRVAATGGPIELVVGGGGLSPPAFTRDGRTMLYDEPSEGYNWNLWMRQLDTDEPAVPLLTEAGWEMHPALSPDGRYLAYSHGGADLFVRSFPDMGGPWQVQPGSGTAPHWSPDGTRLYWLNGGEMMEARVSTAGTFRFEPPASLFSMEFAPVAPSEWPVFDLTPDGERFVIVRALERPAGLILLQNWLDSAQ